MDQPEPGIYSEEMEIVDPHYLCTEGIDNLFVHHLLLDENEVMRGRGGLRKGKFIFGMNDSGFDLKDLFPREVELFSSPLRMDDHANDHGIGFCSLGHEIRDFTHFLAGGVKNASVYKVTEKIEFFEVLIHFLLIEMVLPIPVDSQVGAGNLDPRMVFYFFIATLQKGVKGKV
jgi:hypothetical protein